MSALPPGASHLEDVRNRSSGEDVRRECAGGLEVRPGVVGVALATIVAAIGCSGDDGPPPPPAAASSLEQVFPMSSASAVGTKEWPQEAELRLQSCRYDEPGRWWFVGDIHGVAIGTVLGLDLGVVTADDVGVGYRTAATVRGEGRFELLFDGGDGNDLTPAELHAGVGSGTGCDIVVRAENGDGIAHSKLLRSSTQQTALSS